MTVSADPRVGSVLLGYRIETLLGRGGMSVVYRAEDLALERNVALKLLAPELAEDEGFRERFQRESRLAASLDHPGVVPIYEAGEVQGQLYIAMRYVQGRDLGALLREDGALEPERALDIVSQVADALDDAHEHGLVHRDVKPSNVLVDERGRCYLADFGLTKRSDDRVDLSGSGRLLGSTDYIAPEAIEGDAIDGRADVYSLGCLLYHCLAGVPPYRRDSELATLWAHVHDPPPTIIALPDLDPVVAKALAKDPGKRFATARELSDAARAALPRTEPESRRRSRLALAGAALVVVVAVAALAVPLTRGGEDSPSTTPTPTPTTPSIQRIDPDTNELVATIPFGAATGLQSGHQLVADDDGTVFVANAELNRIYRIDPGTDDVTELPGNGAPFSIAFGAGSLWVTNRNDSTVAEMDPKTGAILRTVPLPTGIVEGPIVANDSSVWLFHASADSEVVRIDPISSRVTPVECRGITQACLGFVVLTPDELWIASWYQATVARLDPVTGTLRSVFELSQSLKGGHVFSDGSGVWFSGTDSMVRLDSRTRRQTNRIDIGMPVHMIGLDGGSLWMTPQAGRHVLKIDPESREVEASIEVGQNLSDILVTDDAVWVAVHPGP